MTTSPPSHISLAKRDSYGFGIDIARALDDNKDSDLEEDDRELEEIQAFAQDDSQAENSVLPTDFTDGLRNGDKPESSVRGIIPDSSYGAHSRFRDGPVEGAEDAEDGVAEDTPLSARRTVNARHAGGVFDSSNIAGDGSEAGSSVKASATLRERNIYEDDEFGDFIQGAQVRIFDGTPVKSVY